MPNPTYLKLKPRLQLVRNSSTRNMSIAEKCSKVIPTVLNGKLIHYSNNKSSKVKPSKYDLKSNRVSTITSNKENDMNGQNSEHKIIMLGYSFVRGLTTLLRLLSAVKPKYARHIHNIRSGCNVKCNNLHTVNGGVKPKCPAV